MTFDPNFRFYRDDREHEALETLADMATEADAEYVRRQRIYPTMIRKGRLAQAEADRELRVMGSIADTLDCAGPPPIAGEDPDAYVARLVADRARRAARVPRGQATWTEKLHCLRREIAIRRQVYPEWVAAGRVDGAEADRKLRVMESIHDMEWNMSWCPEAVTVRAAAISAPSGIDKAA